MPERLGFLIEHRLDCGVRTTVLQRNDFNVWNILIIITKVCVTCVDDESVFQLLLCQRQGIKVLPFNPNGVHSIFSIQEFNHSTRRRLYGKIVVGHGPFRWPLPDNIGCIQFWQLYRLYQSNLLDHQWHGKELLRRQTTQIGIFDKASRFRAKTHLGE